MELFEMSAFLSPRHALGNVASKGYFGKVPELYVKLFLRTAQEPSRYNPRLTHDVSHTERPP